MSPYRREYLRKRFLDKQQTQLAEDAKLADPAEAYRALLAELSQDRDDKDRAAERAA